MEAALSSARFVGAGALVPVVALFPRAETLIVVQVLAVALRGDSARLSSRASLGVEARAANLLAIAYLLDAGGAGTGVRQLFGERVRAAARVRRRAVARAQARVLAVADLRAAAAGAQRRRDSLRALVCGGVRALVGSAHRPRALRAGDRQRRRLFGPSSARSACARTIPDTRWQIFDPGGKVIDGALAARAVCVRAACDRAMAVARRAAARRDRLHAAVELRAQPHRLALRRAAARRHGVAAAFGFATRSSSSRGDGAVRARRHVALQRYGVAAGTLAVRRRLERLRAGGRASR